MTGAAPPFVVRPCPSDADRETMAKRAAGARYKYPGEPSDGWWERGALLVDEGGPALVDADGLRRDFPADVAGGWLVHDWFPVFTGGPIGNGVLVFVAAPTVPHTVVLRLPHQGFEADDFRAFATAAGFVYADTLAVTTEEAVKLYPGRNSGKVPSWTDAVFSRDDLEHRPGARFRRRLGLGRGAS